VTGEAGYLVRRWIGHLDSAAVAWLIGSALAQLLGWLPSPPDRTPADVPESAAAAEVIEAEAAEAA
jgi:hypothetical protein